ncbi:hypothetical protein ACFFMN_32760 [Planobispora siamensis]|nr:hypothetical protein [Planobispora siamensis]
MDQSSGSFPADDFPLPPVEHHRYQALGEVALGTAMAEALARHNHHELAAVHNRAADAYRRLAEAETDNAAEAEYRRLEQWHRSCAVVEEQLAAEADRRLPGPD